MKIKALCAAVFMGMTSLAVPSNATNSNPSGNWQSVGGESRYQISMCGDGSQLCAKLTWLRSDAQTPENLAHLNRLVINKAAATGDNKWSGTVVYDGVSVRGNVTLLNSDRIKVNGCRLVVCQTIELVRL